MRKLLLTVTLLIFVLGLSGCGVFDRGNYDKDRQGYVITNGFIVSYHTNSVGEIDVFMIDEIMSYFEALDYTSFDMTLLDDEAVLSSIVTPTQLNSCGIITTQSIPRFIRIEEQTYYFHIRDNGYCTFDEYEFHEDGFSTALEFSVENTSPLEDLNITMFKDADFTINTYETIIFIETISYNTTSEVWEKEVVSALPMSIRQAGSLVEDNTDYVEEIESLERYVLKNQSINLLELREDYDLENVNNVWSDTTIDILGRDHDVIRTVRTKKVGDILDIINSTLSRLGMFS